MTRVQAPFTLSETFTWPLELYCPNQPTRRSPAVTLPKVRLTLVRRLPVLTEAPWIHTMLGGAVAGVVTDSAGEDWDEWVPPPL